MVSEAKNRVAAALPPDATPKLVVPPRRRELSSTCPCRWCLEASNPAPSQALGLPQDVAAAVAAAARNKPAAEVRALIADLKRNDALRGRVATGALSPSALLELGADERCREDRKRKAPPPIVEEEILAEGYVCETCGSTRVTCATESRPTTSYGTSEFRQILFLDCLDCGRSWQED